MKYLIAGFLCIALSACAGSQRSSSIIEIDDDPVATVMDRGYKLGDEVKRISHYSISGWQYVSDQAVILPGRPGTDYLVLLRNRCHSLRSTDVIGFTGAPSAAINTTLTNFDAIVTYDHPRAFEEKCYIDKMYQLHKNDEEQ